MDKLNLCNITLSDFKWLNEPNKWNLSGDTLYITTDKDTNFWQGTWYNFHYNTGHVFGVEIKDDFTISACIEADFKELYDQAGLMVYHDKQHWLKAGIEYNDGQPMISSVRTDGVSDWATGIFTGDPHKFYLRLTKKNNVICVKYSTDNITWVLSRLCPFPHSGPSLVGPMTCTPKRGGLEVKFSGVKIWKPQDDILHSN